MNLLKSLVVLFTILLIVAVFIRIVSMAFGWIFWIGVGTILGIAIGYYVWGRR